MRKLYWQVLASLCGLAIVAALIVPVFKRARGTERSPESYCQINLKKIMLGFKQYSQDNDEKYPPVRSSGSKYGWADSLSDYIKSAETFQCPSEITLPELQDPRQVGYTDYWYNGNMGGRKATEVTTTRSLIILGDGNDGQDQTDARYSVSTLPAKWVSDPNSPLHRYRKAYGNLGANYAFLDGRVKWYKATEILSPASGTTMDIK